MKKGTCKKIVATAASAALAVALMPAAAFADSSEIVTLGADLTADQKATVLEFFGLSEDELSDMTTINVTNADEHKYCDSTIPSDITGSRTLSCSYIQPTTSGGINVRTANLTYVTSSALYNALQTAGVENCNLVVTAPFDVSGTGALTGVFMAYESTGQAIDEEKALAAVEEMYETSGLQEEYGEDIAGAIGEVKDEVISATKDMSPAEIEQVIRDEAAERNISLSEEDIAKLVDLVEKLKNLDYASDTFSNTLDHLNSALDNAGGKASGFIEKLMGFFSNLFNGGSDAADSIMDKLNTKVFKLD